MKITIDIEVLPLADGGYTLCASDATGKHFAEIRSGERKGPLSALMRTLKTSLYSKRWHMADRMPMDTLCADVAKRCQMLLSTHEEANS